MTWQPHNAAQAQGTTEFASLSGTEMSRPKINNGKLWSNKEHMISKRIFRDFAYFTDHDVYFLLHIDTLFTLCGYLSSRHGVFPS